MKRVVVTGMGVVAPNGVNVAEFNNALLQGTSGLHHIPQMEAWGMGCQVAGYPANFNESILKNYITPGTHKSLRSSNVQYALAATIEAWHNAELTINNNTVDVHTGCVYGSGICDVDHLRYAINMVESDKGLQLGARHIEQLMASGCSGYIGGLLGLGNMVTANSSACSTGTEAIVMAYQHIKYGNATRMVAGSSEASSPYMWSVFDAMRVLNRNHNNQPAQASRPMNSDSAGFIPGSGAATLILEELETALARNAPIIAEIKSGTINSGGQRNGGTMTAPSAIGVIDCITNTLQQAAILPHQIDLICGHLTGTFADKLEIQNWATALQLKGNEFPKINTLKSLTGHCISAAGAIECVAALLQLQHGYIHANYNCATLQPDITNTIASSCIPLQVQQHTINTIIKANFGFGDVNSCIIFNKYT